MIHVDNDTKFIYRKSNILLMLTFLPLLIMNGSIAVPRTRSTRADLGQLNSKVAQRLRDERSSLVMFPEGTRNRSSNQQLLEFKKGAFHFAKQNDVTLQPIVIQSKFPLVDARGLRFYPQNFKSQALAAIDRETVQKLDVNELTKLCRDEMSGALEKLNNSIGTGPIEQNAEEPSVKNVEIEQ